MSKKELKLLKKLDYLCVKYQISYEIKMEFGYGISVNLFIKGEKSHHGGLDYGQYDFPLMCAINEIKEVYGKNNTSIGK